VWWLRKRFNFLSFFIIPAVYFISVLPAYFAGRSMIDLLTVYGMQFDTYHTLNVFAPNLYSLIPNRYYDIVVPLGVLLTFILVCTSIYFILRQNKEIPMQKWIEISLLFLLLIPFAMPKMHDRYFFPADVFSILYFFYYMRRYYVTFFAVGGSFLILFANPRASLIWMPKVAWIFTLLALFFTARNLFFSKNPTTP
jgi:Gpi18-like mannosyltransferase